MSTLYEYVRETFVFLREVHIGIIYRIHLMIRPDPSTQFILYVFYGVHDWGLSRPRQDVDVILSMELWLFTRCVVIYAMCEALRCHAGKCQVRYFAGND